MSNQDAHCHSRASLSGIYKFIPYGVLFLYIAIGFLVFANSLHNSFLIDDFAFFKRGVEPTLTNILSAFIPYSIDVSYYRPFAYIIPMTCNAFFGDHVLGYHIVNIILMAIAAWCVFRLVNKISGNHWIAILTGLFFIIHPVNGLLVNYITASVFSAQVIFMSLSLYFFVIPAKEGRGNDKLVAAVFFILALFCHETAIALPFYALALVYFIQRQSLKAAWRVTWYLWVMAGAYLIFRFFWHSLVKAVLVNLTKHSVDIFQYLATMGKLMWWYASKLVYPEGITLMHAVEPVSNGETWWIVVIIVLVFIALGGVLYHRRVNNIIKLSIAWIAIGFMPMLLASGISPKEGYIVEPHWFVFSSLGFSLIVAFLIISPNSRISRIGNIFKVIVCMALIIVWSFTSRVYNRIWSDEKEYCYVWRSYCPDFPAVSFFLGTSYINVDNTKARYYLEEALLNRPKDFMVYFNLALVDIHEERWQDADVLLAKAQARWPSQLKVIKARGRVLVNLNDREKSIAFLKESVPYADKDPQLMAELLRLAITTKDKEVITAIAAVLSTKTQDPDVLTMCASALSYFGYRQNAQAILMRVLNKHSDFEPALNEKRKWGR